MKTIFRVAMILAATLLAGRIANAELVIQFSHVVTPQTPKGRAADLFAQRVNERLAGRVRVEVFPSSQLYNDDKVMEAMRLSSGKTGIMAAPSLSKFVKFSNNLQTFDLPFLFNGIHEVHKLVDSPLAAELTAPLESKGIKGLVFWDSGMKVFSVRGETPLRKVPDDFQGKKFRIQTSDVRAAMIRALGGVPQKLPFKEVYTALAQGVVDGQENSWSNVYSKKFHEVQDWITVSDHGYLGYLVVVSTDFWNGLPADIRRELMSILREVMVANRQYAAEDDTQDRENVAAAGKAKLVELTPEERAQWISATKVVETQFKDQIGASLLDKTHQLLGH